MNNLIKGSALLMTVLAGGHQETLAQQNKKYDQKKLNVLFIVADDLNNDMGCFDDPIVKTPNLDRLRARAVRFNNAYCQYPFSGPSRASFLTGYMPEKTGVVNLTTNFRDVIPTAVTIPQAFKQNGYFTGRVGKVFHAGVPNDIGQPGMDDPQSWVETWNPIGIDRTDESKIINHTPKRPLGSALAWQVSDAPDDMHTDGIGANVACRMIREHKDGGFFIAMGFYRPHSPYVAPKKYFDLYPMEQIQLPAVPADDWVSRPVYERFTDPLNWGVEAGKLREAKRAYYASISFMDAQVGKLLDELDRQGVADKTIVIFCSDNGYNLGQHGMWMKQALFEHSARVPFIMSVPGMTTTEAKSVRCVQLLDVYPTLAELCELQHVPADLQGNDLRPLLQDPAAEWGKSAYTMLVRTWNPMLGYMKKGERVTGRSIRTERYRYAEWDEGTKGGELYDYQTDPDENVNLYNNAKYAKLQKQLQRELYSKYKRAE